MTALHLKIVRSGFTHNQRSPLALARQDKCNVNYATRALENTLYARFWVSLTL
jgi:hypothetical protein